MQRRRLVQRVMDGLESADQRVAYPDHPLLLRGPDILAVAQGRLTAFFVYNGYGARPAGKHEQARYLLTRLALPRGTRCVLVLDPSVDDDFDNSATLLDSALALAEIRRYVRSSAHKTTPASDVVESVRAFHDARFADTWPRAFDAPYERRGPTPQPGTPTSSTAAPASRPGRLRWMGVDNGVIYARSQGRTAQELRRAFMQATVAATSLDYDLSRGLSGIGEAAARIRSADGHLAVHHLASQRLPRGLPFDPLKPQRAAAFAGIDADGFEEPQ